MTIHTVKFNTLTTDLLYQILKLREKVFVLEQECLYQDMDDIDLNAWHTYTMDEDKIIAYARIYWKDQDKKIVQIGRVVTDPDYRRQRKGSSVMRTAINIAEFELKADWIYIEAQTYAIPFYEKLGFKVTSEEFLEDGIPHVRMMCEIESNTQPLGSRKKCPNCGVGRKDLMKLYDGTVVCLKCYHQFR